MTIIEVVSVARCLHNKGRTSHLGLLMGVEWPQLRMPFDGNPFDWPRVLQVNNGCLLTLNGKTIRLDVRAPRFRTQVDSGLHSTL
jgi:hypothetical protein